MCTRNLLFISKLQNFYVDSYCQHTCRHAMKRRIQSMSYIKKTMVQNPYNRNYKARASEVYITFKQYNTCLCTIFNKKPTLWFLMKFNKLTYVSLDSFALVSKLQIKGRGTNDNAHSVKFIFWKKTQTNKQKN